MLKFFRGRDDSFLVGIFLALGSMLTGAGFTLVGEKEFWWVRVLIGGLMLAFAIWRIVLHSRQAWKQR